MRKRLYPCHQLLLENKCCCGKSIVIITKMQKASSYNKEAERVVASSSTIRISSGDCSIGLIRIDTKNHTCYTTNFLDVNLNVKSYLASHLTFISTELNNSISELYQKIVSMTEMNIEIYDKINGGDK